MLRALYPASILLILGGPVAALDKQPPADYRGRREQVAKHLDGGTAILFAGTEAIGSSALNGYIPDKNFFYLTGWSEPGAALIISASAPANGTEAARPYREVLYLPQRNSLQEQWTGPKMAPDTPESRSWSGFAEVHPLDRMRDDLVGFLPSRAQSIFTHLPALDEAPSSTAGISWLQRANAFSGSVSFREVDSIVADLRRKKDGGEISLIRRAADASMAAHRIALQQIHPGMKERALAGLMEFEMMRAGCERPAYAPVVGSGKNGTILHYAENSGVLRDGDLVVMDVAGEYSLYASDITRTAPVNGKFTPRQRELYNIVLGALEAAATAVVPGKSTFTRTGENSIYNVAFDYINTHGKDLHGQPLGRYFIHGISHYIGLDVHDVGSPAPLEPGMVFSIEPGIYIPEENIGIRIEDMFWIDPQSKLVNLTGGLARTADEVEAAMRRHTRGSR